MPIDKVRCGLEKDHDFKLSRYVQIFEMLFASILHRSFWAVEQSCLLLSRTPII
jgi:hypothetical protein